MAVRKNPRSRSVTLAMGAVIVGALALAVGFGVSRSRTGTGGIAGVGLVDSGRAGGDDARGAESLADLRDGRLAEAFSRYASPGDGGPGAGALRTLGDALLARDRLVLGWAALE